MQKHYLFCGLLLLIHTEVFSQKMLPSGEWCANKEHQNSGASWVVANDLRSDSVDILHTHLEMDITDFTGTKITGHATVTFQPLVNNVEELRLDLLGITVDNVLVDGLPAVWTYNNSVINIALPVPQGPATTHTTDIFYHGKPVQDASGWGGFYWQSGYAYNLGVGFAADPHNYGRAWFPCFDNFSERCTFTVNVTCPGDKRAFSNGALTADSVLNTGQRFSSWEITHPIPSYLACVAVGPYTSYNRTVPGENGPIPVQIAVTPADTNRLKGSFLHLPDAVAAFEYWYGPYRWNKVGYSLVPFNSGAMEHATNIAYMKDAVDGTVNNETLMAHELSHHWWGDLATCSSAEDMWLNEGWASFSEHLFLEKVYGKERYIKAVQDNFLDVLEHTHVDEGGYRAVSGIPHDLTYGDHVYHKGAVVAHSLRGYMEDSTFRQGLRSVMAQTQFTDFSSHDFEEKMSAATGIDLSHFFENWVFSPGFIDFTIDSTVIINDPSLQITTSKVYVKQRLRGAPAFYTNVPLEFTFKGINGQPIYKSAMVSGEQSVATFIFNDADPLVSAIPHINTRQRILQARAISTKDSASVGLFALIPAKLTLKVNAPGETPPSFRIEYHYAMPDTAGATTPDMRLSNRFWIVEAQTNAGFDGYLSFTYDGRGKLDQLDHELFAATSNNEDSIRLMYRPGPGFQWQEHPNYTKNTLGSTTDKFGQLRAISILPGEYTIAKAPGIVSNTTEPSHSATINCVAIPNPSTGKSRITSNESIQKIRVFNMQGDLILEQSGTNPDIDLKGVAAGTYNVVVFTASGRISGCSLVIGL